MTSYFLFVTNVYVTPPQKRNFTAKTMGFLVIIIIQKYISQKKFTVASLHVTLACH